MKYFNFYILLLLLVCSCKIKNTNQEMQGLWKLEKFEYWNAVSNSWQIDSNRIGYHGFIIYDGLGHMAIHLTPSSYDSFEFKANLDSTDLIGLRKQLKNQKTNYVYFANYSMQDSTLKHEKISATDPKDAGKVATRYYKMDSDTLWLSTAEKVQGKKLRLKWIKVK